MGDGTPRILAFAGSARQGSFNKQLVAEAARAVAEAGVACTLIDLRDYPLPLYDGDLEASEGQPPAAARLRELFREHQGLLVASPEYNSSISPLLKNTLDWVSRSAEARPDLSGFDGKVAALLAASPGPLGGMRGLVVLRSLLSNVGVTVLARQVTLRGAADAFADGRLHDERQVGQVTALAQELVRVVTRLNAS